MRAVNTKTTSSGYKVPSRRAVYSCFVLLSVIVTGCSSLSNGFDPFDASLDNVNVSQVQADPSIPLVVDNNSESGKSLSGNGKFLKVRWGGTIVEVQNLQGPVTQFEIVSRPLERTGKPLHSDESSGRFLARVEKFIDPEIIGVGRDITFTGNLIGRYNGKIGESEYVFPVLQASDYTFWTESVVQPTQHFPDWDKFRKRQLLRPRH